MHSMTQLRKQAELGLFNIDKGPPSSSLSPPFLTPPLPFPLPSIP